LFIVPNDGCFLLVCCTWWWSFISFDAPTLVMVVFFFLCVCLWNGCFLPQKEILSFSSFTQCDCYSF
jgi:hypothetical protein